MDLCVCITSKEKPNQTRTEEIKAQVVPAGKGNQTTLYGQRVGKLEMNHEVKKEILKPLKELEAKRSPLRLGLVTQGKLGQAWSSQLLTLTNKRLRA